jgi:phage gpG-like protein
VIAVQLVGSDRLPGRLRELLAEANSGLVRAITELTIELQRRVQDKLSGEVLSSSSGSLKSNIGFRVDQHSASVTGAVFSDNAYARVHEYGFAGTVNVKASLRRITEAFGRPITGKTIEVKGHTRRVDLPERSFLRSALEDMTPAIRDAVEEALRETVGMDG